MNIADMMKIKGEWEDFSKNHPQFVKFLSYMASTDIPEGTIFSIVVKKPESENEIKTNLLVKKSDLEMVETLKSIAGKRK